MQSPKKFAGIGVLAAALALTGCAAQGDVRQPRFRLMVFLDQSASVDVAQRAAWMNEAAGLVQQLRPGWSIAIYPIHDRTMDSAALFEAEIPESKDDATADEARVQHRTLVRARDGARAAIAKGLDSGTAVRTDIFSTIDRIQPDPHQRRTRIVYFSDMLNSTPDLNMEVPGTVTRSSIAANLQSLARRHYWQSGQLAGADVVCVLNSIESGHKGPPVDRLTQKAFYAALFQALGAQLVGYDTHFAASILKPQQGGAYVASR